MAYYETETSVYIGVVLSSSVGLQLLRECTIMLYVPLKIRNLTKKVLILSCAENRRPSERFVYFDLTDWRGKLIS